MSDPNYDWTATAETRKEYMDNIEQQYTYFCYGEKDEEACQKRAEFLINFRVNYMKGTEELLRCCKDHKSPGCCNQAAKLMLFNEAEKNQYLDKFNFDSYWDMMKVILKVVLRRWQSVTMKIYKKITNLFF
jgi:hypothetical protein